MSNKKEVFCSECKHSEFFSVCKHENNNIKIKDHWDISTKYKLKSFKINKKK
jgi:TPP-dependent indolepyruvate ferredoxin oxidoreductase alpha subunit